MINYGKQTIDEDDINAVVAVLRSDYLTQGPSVELFERDLAEYCGTKYAVVFNNATSALQAAYNAAELTDGDEVISSPLTFAATTNAALWFQAKPVFADVEFLTGNINVNTLEKLISKKTRILAPVDFAGNPADIDHVMDLARKKGLVVIEDACHALGAKSKGRMIGSLSDITTFSFHPVKSITTGEGGALLTNNHKYYESAKRFRGHGIVRDGFLGSAPASWYYEMQTLGMNLRLTDFQSALGSSQLKKLSNFIERRKIIATRYLEIFQKLPNLRVIQPNNFDESSWHLFVLVLDGSLAIHRDKIFEELRRRGIGVQLHYIPVYKHPYYKKIGYVDGLCPVAEKLSNSMISLPIYPSLSNDDQNMVIESVIDVLRKFN